MDKCFCHFNGYEVKDANARKTINGLRRKLIAIAGTLQLIDENKRKDRCEVYEVAENGTYVTLLCSFGDESRQLRISTSATASALYEVYRLAGYGITANTIYSAKTANKTLHGVWIDGTKYDSIDVLKTTGLTFESLAILYTVNEGDYTINTCLTVNAHGFRVYESVPENPAVSPLVKCVAASNYITHCFPASDNFAAFSIQGGDRIYIETVEDLGQTVVKTFDFNGGF